MTNKKEEPTSKLFEKIVDALHARLGFCGHCGEKNCPLRSSWSVLPVKLHKDDVLEILDEVLINGK